MKQLLGFYVLLTTFTAVIWGLDYYILEQGFLRELDNNVMSYSYLFIYILTLLGYSAIHLVSKKDFDKVGLAFGGLCLLKMGAALVFIYVSLPEDQAAKMDFAFHFMTIYFIFLILEIILVSRLLKTSPKATAQ